MVRALGILFILFCAQHITAQRILVTPSTVSANTDEPFTLTYELNGGQAQDMLIPSFKDFHIVGGPNTANSISIFNGRRSSKSSVSYFLQPKKAGRFIIAPAKLAGKGEESQSKPVTVVAKQGKVKPLVSETGDAESLPPIFIKTVLDTSTVYWGQQVTVNYRVFTQEKITNYTIQELPAFPGFWVQDITPKYPHPRNEVINGVTYSTRDLKRFALFPQKTGDLELDLIDAEITYQKQVPRSRGFFRYQNLKGDFQSEPATVKVKPLPETDLKGSFIGGVGTFNVNGKVDRNTCRVDEAVTYTVRLSGKGNIKLVDLPELQDTEAFEFYEPEVTEQLGNGDEIGGTKTFKYVVVPRKEGRQVIEGEEIYYFDPKSEAYRSLRMPRAILQVAPSAITDSEEPVAKVETIDPIFTGNIDRVSKLKRAYQSFGLLAAYGFPLLFLSGFLIWHKRREEELGDVVGYRKKQASKEAQKRLRTAQALMNTGKDKDFYDEILRALQKYFEDKLAMPAGDFSKELIESTLGKKNISPENRSLVNELIQKCEVALYAPAAVVGGQEGIFQKAEEVIHSLENQLT